MKYIDKNKRVVVKIAQQKLGLGDEEYRDILHSITGGRTESSKELTSCEFDDVMAYFRHLGYADGLRMSKKQYGTIRKMQKQLGWDRDPKLLAGFCKRTCGTENWRRLDIRGASKLINGLIQIIRGGYGKQTCVE